MKRLSFFAIQLPDGALARIRSGAEREKLLRTSESGFVLTRTSSSTIAGKYVQRASWEQQVVDPIRGAISVPRISVESTAFRIVGRGGILELHDPPRSTAEFFATLSWLTDFSLTIGRFKADPLRWAEALSRDCSNLNVIRLSTERLGNSRGFAASLELVGTDDVRGELQRHRHFRDALAKQIRVGFEWKGRAYQLAISSDARLRSQRDLPDTLVRVLRRSLSESLVQR